MHSEESYASSKSKHHLWTTHDRSADLDGSRFLQIQGDYGILDNNAIPFTRGLSEFHGCKERNDRRIHDTGCQEEKQKIT